MHSFRSENGFCRVYHKRSEISFCGHFIIFRSFIFRKTRLCLSVIADISGLIIRNKVLNACIFNCQKTMKRRTTEWSVFVPFTCYHWEMLFGDSILKFFQKFFLLNAKKLLASQYKRNKQLNLYYSNVTAQQYVSCEPS